MLPLSKAAAVLIRNNRVENTGSHNIFTTAHGIAVESASDTVVANNVVSGTTETFLASGISVNFSALIEVRGNSILDTKDTTTKRGIDIAGSTDVTVIGNRIVNAAGTGTQGIVDSGGSTGINCIDNTIAGFIAPLDGCDFEAGNNTGGPPAVVQHDLEASRFTTARAFSKLIESEGMPKAVRIWFKLHAGEGGHRGR